MDLRKKVADMLPLLTMLASANHREGCRTAGMDPEYPLM